MAKKEDRKKQKKKLKEQKRAAERRQYIAAIQRANRYPRIRVFPTGGDPEFVAEIERLVNEFSFDDPECCPETLRVHYKTIAELGLQHYFSIVNEQAYAEYPDRAVREAVVERHLMDVYLHFGSWLYQELPSRFKEAEPPLYYFHTLLAGSSIEVRCELLEAVGEPENLLYIPPDEPTVVMQGAKWKVGLYHHALERMCRRLQLVTPRTYADYLHLHTVLNDKMLAYEPVTLTNGSEALRVDMEMPLTTAFFDYYARFTKKILGLPETHVFSERDVMYRVLGYLPMQVQGRYARAKTFLLPGFTKTPECELARRKAATPAERLLLQAMTDEEKRTGDIQGETIEAIKWYHDNGVPQVFRKKK